MEDNRFVVGLGEVLRDKFYKNGKTSRKRRSLGGLFALWASTQTDSFKAVAAASPSVWIHGWLPFARKHVPMADAVYLSLGDQEEHVKNQAIARVGDNLRAQHELQQRQLGPERCALVWEEGNHFSDNEDRLARAFVWCMARL